MPLVVHVTGETLALKLCTDLEVHNNLIGLRRIVRKKKPY